MIKVASGDGSTGVGGFSTGPAFAPAHHEAETPSFFAWDTPVGGDDRGKNAP